MTSSKASNRKKSAAGKKKTPARSASAPKQEKSEEQLLQEKEIAGIILIALAVLLLVNFILAPHPGEGAESTIGVVSLFFSKLLYFCAGRGAVVLPLCMLVYGVWVCLDRNRGSGRRLSGLGLLLLGFLGFLQLNAEMTDFVPYFTEAAQGNGGGAVGALLTFVFVKTLGRAGAIILFIVLLLVGLLLFFRTSLSQIGQGLGRSKEKVHEVLTAEHPEREPRRPRREQVAEAPLITETKAKTRPLPADQPLPTEQPAPEPEKPAPTAESAADRFALLAKTEPENNAPAWSFGEAQDEPGDKEEQPVRREAAPKKGIVPPTTPFVREYMPTISQDAALTREKTQPVPEPEAPAPAVETLFPEDEAEDTAPPAKQQPMASFAPEDGSVRESKLPETERKRNTAAISPEKRAAYVLPTSDLISTGIKVKNPRMDKVITDSITMLESTLESFGVKARVVQVVPGPAVVRYELQPAPGVKVSRITSLADDIALTLAAQSVRIEAPIPGKSAIGIEVSRKEVETVYFRELIESDAFRQSKKLLGFVLGKNIAGECVVADLGKMPHLLIAGTTGSGKSVCVNTLICSILFKARPDQVKLMLIDPKKVEMMQFANLPHLIAPVVNDSKKAANALKWVVEEMESRYTLFVDNLVRDFDGYNGAHPDDPLPHIVVIIDELADLMMVARHDVEDSICRLAQMARAAGIHLVVATQRPSVDVITGLIKSNIPSRIAFAVSSFTDSRTILDMGGAEKLLGRGDMLFAPVGVNKPLRVQGSFIDPADVNRLVAYCAAQAQPSFSQAAVEAASTAAVDRAPAERDDDEDELLYDAGSLIISSGQASVSYLQRRLAIGNPRAARLMDILEAKGVVGCSKGSKPRDILMSMAEFEELFA